MEIKLINIGRNNYCGVIKPKVTTEEFLKSRAESIEHFLAEKALVEVEKHLLSRDVSLEPDEKKGVGYWKVYAGMYHVGDVEIS